MKKRVVITGLGAVTQIGIGIKEIIRNYLAGTSGIHIIHSLNTEHALELAGKISDEALYDYVSQDKQAQVDRFSLLMLVASKIALEDSKLDVPNISNKIGVYVGSAYCGMSSIEKQSAILYANGPRKVHPRLMQNNIANAASGEVAIELGLNGANVAFSVGFCSGAHTLVQAYNALQLNNLEAIVAGGTEAPILAAIYKKLAHLGKLSQNTKNPEKACRPFDKKRDGFVLSEGSGVLILENLEHAKARGAHIYAEVLGYAMTYNCNYWKLNISDKEIKMTRTMRLALKDANITPSDVDYINAYGISTQEDDEAESQAIKTVFDKHAPSLMISSTKSALGYSIAGSDAIEAAICAFSIKNDIILPTINYEFPDPQCDLNYVTNQPCEKETNIALSNTFGLDGNFTTLIFQKLD